MTDRPAGPPRPRAGARWGRRRLLAAGAGTALAPLLPVPADARAGTRRRPNILWLVSEDNNPYLGAYGDPAAHTPAIDGLAAEGVRYANFFAASPVCAPTRFSIITGLHAESCGPAEHMRARGNTPAWLRGFPTYLREAGYYCTNNFKTDYNAPVDPAETWDASGPSAHWRDRPEGSPFFAVFNFDESHESTVFAPAPGTTPPDAVRIPAHSPDTPTTRRDKAHYYDMIRAMDARVAARLAELREAGLDGDTVVFYYGDHGGPLLRSKRFCFDSGLHSPLVVRVPRRWEHLAPGRPGDVVTAPVSSVDLPATVLSLAGLARPDHMGGTPFAGTARGRRRYAFSGRNRMDERYDMQRTVRDERFRYVRNYMPHLPYGQHVSFMWGQAGYREWEQLHLDGALDEVRSRFWREKPAEELYDLEADPDEVRNLAGDAAHAGELDRLRRALDDHMAAVNDNGFIPEGSPLEGYDASRGPGAYPLRAVMGLAGRAIERDPSHLPSFTAALGHANEVMRYWAALACVMLGEGAAPAAEELSRVLRHDASVHVRIAAGEALAGLGRAERPVAFLAETLEDHPDVRVQLQALNALTNIGERARPALPQIAAASASSDEYVGNAARYLTRVLTGTYVPSP